jgi:ATP-dependent Clp protease protease subunit
MEKDASTEDEARAANPVAARLFESRTVLLFGEITMESAQAVSAQLLALAAAGSAPIRVVVNSPGGHVESGDTLHDVLRFIDVEVNVLGTGWVASAGALVYCAVPRARRFCLPNTRFLLHQPLGGVGGKVSDVEIEAAEMVKMRERLQRIFAEATGQPLERLVRDMDRNHWLTAREAVDYGLCGTIVRSARELGRGAPAVPNPR